MKEAIKNFLRSLIERIDGGRQVFAQQLEMARMVGITLALQDATTKANTEACSHRKAGTVRLPGTAASIRRQLNGGNGSQYAVRKHQMMNGDIWVDCLRCGKKWRPPVKANFTRQTWYGRTVIDEVAFSAAYAEYDAALKFETNNTMSASLQCRFSDPKTGKRADHVVRAMYAAIGE